MNARVLIDTGPIVAMLNPREQHHDACVEIFRNLIDPPLTCWPVITEAMWLLRKSAVGQRKPLEALEIGAIQLLTIDHASVPALKGSFDRYKTLRPQIADLCLVYLADREQIQTIFTLDRRDFKAYRFLGRSAFRLLPAL